jgi:predicted Zn-dependent peptidase
MGLESQLGQLEDLSRQVMMQNRRLEVTTMCERIDMVTKADLVRCARRVVLGEDTKSPYEFDDSVHWKRTGDGRPSVLVHAPLFPNDSFLKIEDTLKTWGLMGPGYAQNKWF